MSTESALISLKGDNLPLKKVFDEILNKTGYKVIFDLNGQLQNTAVTFDWKNESLEQALRQIIKKSGIKNFVILTDDKNRTLRVFNFNLATSTDNLPVVNSDDTGLKLQELKALHDRQKREIQMMENDPDEIVIPPEGDQPGVTREQLQALHERQKEQIAIEANDPDAIAVPASEGYPALTNRQLQQLHERQKSMIKRMQDNPDEIVIPPEGGHTGITRSQLQVLHERQQKEIESSEKNPDAIAVPASEDHPALTFRELQELHKRQKSMIRNQNAGSGSGSEGN